MCKRYTRQRALIGENMVSVVNSNKDIVIDTDANIIFKYGNYTNTYVNIDISGIPNNIILNLVDENDEVLFSPFDLNGNYVRSQCFVNTAKGKHIIQLPASYNNDYSTWEDFPVGQYQWSLYFAGNDSYESIRIPLNVEIRDFKIWDIQTPQIYPDDNVEVKLKTYGDTYYPADSEYLSNFLLDDNISYDDSTGIITFLNAMLTDKSLGEHSQTVNAVTKHTINYEVLNPIEFYYSGTQLYEGEKKVGYKIKKSSMFSRIIGGINGNIRINNKYVSTNGFIYTDKEEAILANKYNGYRFPPGIYNCIVVPGSGNATVDNVSYTCEGSFEISTQGCDLELDFSAPESEYKEDMTSSANSSLQISGSDATANKVNNKLHISNANFSYTHPDGFNEVSLTFSSGSFIPDEIYVRGEHLEISNMPNYSSQANTDITIKIYFCDYSSSQSDPEGSIIIEYNDDTTSLDWSPTEAASYEDNNVSFTVSEEEVILSDFSVRQTNILSEEHPTTELVSNYIYNDSHPISGATIKLINTKNNSEIETKVTDDNGQCKWTIENSGRYKVIATNIYDEELLASNEQKVRSIKYVTNNNEWLDAYNTIEDGDIIFVKSGTYSLNDFPSDMNYPSCEIIGDSPKPIIKNTSSSNRYFRTKDDSSVLKVSNLYFENTSQVIVITNQIDSNNDGGRIEVYNCDWVGARKQYNWQAIVTRIGNVLVDSCTFRDNKTTDYGHICTAIMAYKNSSFSDITVKRCTFDGNINSGNVHNGNAAATITSTDTYSYSNYATAQLNDVHFYCNTYAQSGDTLYGVEEELCVRHIELTSDKTILSYKDRDNCILSALATNIDNDGVPNQSVDFYVNNVLIGTEYTDANGIATYTYESTGAGEIEFIASCRDIVSETYAVQDYLFKPPLDGTDAITSWTSMTNKTEDGIYYSHGSFLTDGWNNEGLWQLDFDVCSSNWGYVGLMPVCSEEINPYTDAKSKNYAMTSWEGLAYFGGLDQTVISETTMSKITSLNTWHHVTIQKLNDLYCKIIINNTYESIRRYNNLQNLSELHLGTRDNAYGRNEGGIIQFKNIKVTIKEQKDLSSGIKVDNTTFNILAPDTLSITGMISVPNATVKLMEDNTQLGTATSDNNGNFTITDISFTAGTHMVKVVYDGDAIYNASQSPNITVNVKNIASVSLTGDKSILSYYDEETCILSATVLDENGDEVRGEQVNFYADETLLGSSYTNNNGVATYNYVSTGVGDIEFTASVGNIVSEIYVVEDCVYANDGSHVNGLTAQSGVSVTSDGEWVSISTSTSGEKYVITPTSFSSSDNFEFECKINKTNSNFHAIAFGILDENSFSLFNNIYMNYDVSTNNFNLRLRGNSGSVTKVSRTLSDGDTITIQRQNETWIVLHNDEQIHTIAYSWAGNKTLGFYTNKDRKQLLKDLKIKALPNVASVSLTGNKEILSYYDGDECTLSATVLNEKR